LVSVADKQGSEHPANGAQGGIHTLTRRATPCCHGAASSYSGVAQGGIYGLAFSYGGLHPGIASYNSSALTSGAAQGGIHGLVSSQGGLCPESATLSSYTSTSGAAQGGIHGLNFSQGGFHPSDTIDNTQGGRQINF